jgi:hypothetical protein
MSTARRLKESAFVIERNDTIAADKKVCAADATQCGLR